MSQLTSYWHCYKAEQEAELKPDGCPATTKTNSKGVWLSKYIKHISKYAAVQSNHLTTYDYEMEPVTEHHLANGVNNQMNLVVYSFNACNCHDDVLTTALKKR